MNFDSDYSSKINGKGGSKKGRDTRKPDYIIKYFSRLWAIKNIANGEETYFIHAPFHSGRFSRKLYLPLIPILYQLFPEETSAYLSGRENRADNIIANRIHKMYYFYKNGVRSRGISNEHPLRWKPEILEKVMNKMKDIKYEF